MPVSRHQRIKELFLVACELPPDEVAPFLEERCRGEEDLRADVASLLAYDAAGGADSSAETPVLGFGSGLARQPERIGPYRLLRKLGEGGMGEVYEAEQEEPVRRRVAIKVIRWGHGSREVLARFESERQALAMMSHPNIAAILDAGTTVDGRPFFAMELVRGLPITEYSDEARLSTRQRLELFDAVCRGVQHAHQKGVIHRDLKPSNVLVTVHEKRPTPKIIDFGVAKATAQRLTERTLLTQLGQWIGTPEYMSPEQAEVSMLDVDTRTDVYSLGVIFYELLVGVPPFESVERGPAALDEVRRRIREDDPPKPSTRLSRMGAASEAVARRRGTDPSGLARQLRGDLDWIVIKALEKDRERRYGSPAELAADVGRHLRHEPVLAGPPSAAYRLGKFLRRNRLAVTAAALVALALVGGAALAGVGLLRARAAERQARAEAAAAREVSDFLVGVFDVLNPWDSGAPGASVRQLLRQGAVRLEGELAGQPLVQARLLESIGAASLHFGDYEASAAMLERALALRSELHGESDPEVARGHYRLGAQYSTTGDFARAAEHYERAVAIFERAPGAEPAQLAQTLNELGTLRLQTSRFAEAERLVERAMALYEAAPATPSQPMVWTFLLRSDLQASAADWAGSLATIARARELQESLAGAEHPVLSVIDLSHGSLLLEAGRPEAARPLLERALERCERFFGPENPIYASALLSMAALETRAGRYQAAGPLHTRSLEVREAAQGRDHPAVGLTLVEFALFLRETGDLPGARDRLERALRILEDTLGPETFAAAQGLSSLAEVELRAGELERARALAERSVVIRRKLFGEGHARVGEGLFGLARVAAADGRSAEAVERLEAALAGDPWGPAELDDGVFSRLRGSVRFESAAAELRRRAGAVAAAAEAADAG